VTFAAAWPLTRLLDLEWLKMRAPYAQAAGEQLAAHHAWAVRGAVLLGGMLVALSVVRLVPGRRLPFVTYLGSGGLYIYLLHPLVLRPLTAADVPARLDSWPEQAGLVVAAVLVSAVLASPPVRRLTRHVVQPRLARERPPAGRGAVSTGGSRSRGCGVRPS
jgi:fucose 4-O-acetylase-like acetyltransferase